jgi:hypothetical protein
MSTVRTTVGQPPREVWHGTYTAICYSNNDPKNEQRIKMQIPQVMGRAVSNWATPFGLGVTAIPAIGQIIHAQFMGGDINRPVYINISGLSADLSGLSGDITSLTATVTALTATVTTLSSTVSILSTAVSTLNSEHTTDAGNITTLQSQVSSINTTLSDLAPLAFSLQAVNAAAKIGSDPTPSSGNPPTGGTNATGVAGALNTYLIALAGNLNTLQGYVDNIATDLNSLYDQAQLSGWML